MASFVRIMFMVDLAVFALVLLAIPCVLIALVFRKTPSNQTH